MKESDSDYIHGKRTKHPTYYENVVESLDGKKYYYYKCEHCKITYKEKELMACLLELGKIDVMINDYYTPFIKSKLDNKDIHYEKKLKELDKQLDRIKSVYIKGIMKIDEFENEIKQIEFPNIQGMSARNLRYMQKFAKEYDRDEFLQRLLAKLSWNHNQILLDKIKDKNERNWYATKSIENGWSTTVLSYQISLKLYDRQALLENKTENYSKTLPTDISDKAREMLKDPYIFDFLLPRLSMNLKWDKNFK